MHIQFEIRFVFKFVYIFEKLTKKINILAICTRSERTVLDLAGGDRGGIVPLQDVPLQRNSPTPRSTNFLKDIHFFLAFSYPNVESNPVRRLAFSFATFWWFLRDCYSTARLPFYSPISMYLRAIEFLENRAIPIDAHTKDFTDYTTYLISTRLQVLSLKRYAEVNAKTLQGGGRHILT